MDLTFTEEQELFRRTVAEFMDRECPREYVRELDEQRRYPYELYAKWAKEGWLGLLLPEEVGGGGIGKVEMCIFAEGISVRGHDVAVAYSTPCLAALDLAMIGNEEQKQEYLPPFTQGKLRLAVSFTEPESGSDTASLSTRAYLDGDEFVINGEKVFCPVAHVEDTIIQIAVKTDPEAPRGKGISLLLVENNAPGVEIRRMKTMGHFITGLNQIVLRNVRVPRSRVMGPLHEGLQAYLRHHATTARLFLAASHIGAAQTVVNDALQYAKEREQFGQPIGKFQAIGHMLADMQTDVDAARLLIYRAASYADHDLPNLKEASQAKLYSGEVYFRVANQGMQIMGGYGYMMEYDMQRYMREARPATIAAGSSQIMRNLIAQQMGL